MNWNEAQIRELYRQAATGTGMDDTALTQLAAGQAPVDEATLAALARNGDAADAQRVLREIAAWSGQGQQHQRARWWPVAAALTLLLAGAWLGLPLLQTQTDEVLRGMPDSGFRPMDGTELAAPPDRLLWPAVPEAAAYRVTLYDADLQSVWQSQWLDSPGVWLPAGLPPPGTRGPWFWRITVDRELGFEDLPLQSFSIVSADRDAGGRRSE